MMEGFRRVDEWRLIEDSFDFEDVLYQDQQVIGKQGDQLEEAERAVLDRVDGFRTVAEVIDSIAMSSFDTSKVVYRLLKARYISRGGND